MSPHQSAGVRPARPGSSKAQIRRLAVVDHLLSLIQQGDHGACPALVAKLIEAFWGHPHYGASPHFHQAFSLVQRAFADGSYIPKDPADVRLWHRLSQLADNRALHAQRRSQLVGFKRSKPASGKPRRKIRPGRVVKNFGRKLDELRDKHEERVERLQDRAPTPKRPPRARLIFTPFETSRRKH